MVMIEPQSRGVWTVSFAKVVANDSSFSSSKLGVEGVECTSLYSEGVVSHSPGLPASAGYPGRQNGLANYPEGVASFEKYR